MNTMLCRVFSWLPREVVKALSDLPVPREEWTEIRLRAGAPASLTYGERGKNTILDGLAVSEYTLRTVLSAVCGGSVHAYDEELRRGYLTPDGAEGIRVGAAGRVLTNGDTVLRLQRLSSLCIRLPHKPDCDFHEAEMLVRTGREARTVIPPESLSQPGEHIIPTLFYAPPGGGKTTLLRGLIRALSAKNRELPLRCAVIDTGEELYSADFSDCIADFFSGYPRGVGISIAARAFSPQAILCDELGTEAEAETILRAQAVGVPMIATAHGDSLAGLLRRPCFRRLYENGVFAQYVRIRRTGGEFVLEREEIP